MGIKKAIAIILSASMLAVCSGCASSGSIYSNYKEIEILQLIQTIGIDSLGRGVELSVSSGTGTKDIPPTILSGIGASIPQAMQRVQDFAEFQELFYPHMKYVIIGQEAAENGIFDYIDYIQRASRMRLSAGMFVVRGGTAKELVTHVGGDTSDITDVLASLEREVKVTGQTHVFSCKDSASQLISRGSCLICAIEASPIDENIYSGKSGSTPSRSEQGSSGGSSSGSSGSGSEGESDSGESSSGGQGGSSGGSSGGGTAPLSALPSGYAVMSDWKLAAFLDEDQSWGADILLGMGGSGAFTLEDINGQKAVLSLGSSNASFEPVWDGKSISSINVPVSLELSILELPSDAELDSAEYISQLERITAGAVSSWINEVLGISAELGADFLGIGERIRSRHPFRFGSMDRQWSDILGSVPFYVSVSASIEQSFDLNDPVSSTGEVK